MWIYPAWFIATPSQWRPSLRMKVDQQGNIWHFHAHALDTADPQEESPASSTEFVLHLERGELVIPMKVVSGKKDFFGLFTVMSELYPYWKLQPEDISLSVHGGTSFETDDSDAMDTSLGIRLRGTQEWGGSLSPYCQMMILLCGVEWIEPFLEKEWPGKVFAK